MVFCIIEINVKGAFAVPKDNSNFFDRKSIWSEVKDELLGCYLVPYFSKMLAMQRPLLYIDCFAGKGSFGDGKPGSPIIAMKSLNTSVDSFHGETLPSIYAGFIELNHAEQLESLVKTYPKRFQYYKVISGKFEDHIIPMLEYMRRRHSSCNVFLYVDPYGVKVLNAELFVKLPEWFDTAELLINLNSFGFVREACRVMNVRFREGEAVLSDLCEYDYSVMDSVEELNAVAGGDYWQQVIRDYRADHFDCYEAEKRFSALYKDYLRKSYDYVLDMPIRLKAGQHPKYRMVHATNHPDGCILMADNIAKRTDYLVIEIQNHGQMTLFDQTAENEDVSDELLNTKMAKLLDDFPEHRRLNIVLAQFFNRYGVLCGSPRLSSGRDGSVLKRMEKTGYIEVVRTPAFTENGRPTSFWQESRGNVILIRKKSQWKQ